MKASAMRVLAANTVREPSPSTPRLARGIVNAVNGAEVTLALETGVEVKAEMALSTRYSPCEGDVLLVIGNDEEHFVIGVLSGRGKTRFDIEGDVSLRAVNGRLDLAGDKGVNLRGPDVEITADNLKVAAQAVVHTFASLFQRVSGMLHTQAREEISIVDEGSFKQAKIASIQAEETVTVQGKEIHLG